MINLAFVVSYWFCGYSLPENLFSLFQYIFKHELISAHIELQHECIFNFDLSISKLDNSQFQI